MRNLFILVTLFVLTSCATVLKGTDQSITFTSSPEGAVVLIDGVERGVTPLTVKLKKNQFDTIMIKKKGYKTVSRPLEKSFDGVAIINVFWDLSTTDAVTGAIYEYSPNSYHFELRKKSKTTAMR
ncbi:PEGA domain protein [Bacteriovorax sp. BAL6_X]|uniref:PEGA domain-containing protein n=1 Tax=Bacteriovorax sp. BAL6_X TaxID=1201290 RepID=UPI00038573D1|nr:PEGA domain-containing protein [Bacteriovorax sp. BAL6_X]EPZ49793.1 PEGA domain protein [Bacteriovorax sp. BAL6_X]